MAPKLSTSRQKEVSDDDSDEYDYDADEASFADESDEDEKYDENLDDSNLDDNNRTFRRSSPPPVARPRPKLRYSDSHSPAKAPRASTSTTTSAKVAPKAKPTNASSLRPAALPNFKKISKPAQTSNVAQHSSHLGIMFFSSSNRQACLVPSHASSRLSLDD